MQVIKNDNWEVQKKDDYPKCISLYVILVIIILFILYCYQFKK